jgi:Ca2+-binding EF-hand superfamily protein
VNFENLDTDGDGRLSREEMDQAGGPRGGPPEDLFDRMDTDGDGYVTEAERQAMREQWRSRHKGHGQGQRRQDG